MVKINLGILELEIREKTDQDRLKYALKRYEKSVKGKSFSDYEKVETAKKALDDEGLFNLPKPNMQDFTSAVMLGIIRRRYPPEYEDLLARKLVDEKLTLDDFSRHTIKY
jgi:hypothetical protein